MQKGQDLVSIIIPVYNGANFMKEAIDSALNQTYGNIEVLVINDGSNDDGATEAIAKSYGDRVRYFKKENGGVSSALNLGIREMRGVYFSWLSHDDVYAPEKIEREIELLRCYSGQKCVALCNVHQIDENSKLIGHSLYTDLFDCDRIISWRDAINSIFDKGCMNGCGLLIPQEAFEQCGGFDERLRFCQDMLKWLQIFLDGYCLVYSNEVLVYSRVHNAQLTQTGRKLFHSDSEIIGEMLIPELSSISSPEYDFLWHFAKNNAIYGNQGVVEKCIMQSRSKDLWGTFSLFELKTLCLYGCRFRPHMRKLYYKYIKHVVTQE